VRRARRPAGRTARTRAARAAAAGLWLLLAAACAPAAGDAAGPVAVAVATGCGGGPAVTVGTAAELADALAAAGPGDTVRLADGRYPGSFAIASRGTPERPVTLCGGRGAVLDGGAPDAGTTLHLRGADHWRLVGFTVRGGKKGLMIDGSTGVLVEGLLIHEVGDEALHLRAHSSDNVVRGTTIRDTGLRRARFGEGVYVGSAQDNWCRYTACAPDRSDGNRIEGNDISGTTAEAVDIKEGTTGGVLTGNRFSGAAMTEADSWVDVKGNGWTVTSNTGTDSPEDGFQVHTVLDGWGRDTVFEDNVAAVDGPGYGFHPTDPDAGTVVGCSNTASGAAAGISSVPCT
jgi:hypothetical protein